MKKISVSESQKISSPHPFGLVVSVDDKKTVNAMGVSWWTYVSSNPPLIAVCLSKRSHSNSNIKQSGEFTLCLPDESLKEKAWKCSTSSGRNVNKISEYNIEVVQSEQIDVPIIKDSVVAFECKVHETVEAGDHTIFIADVLEVYGDENKKQLYAVKGYADLATVSIG